MLIRYTSKFVVSLENKFKSLRTRSTKGIHSQLNMSASFKLPKKNKKKRKISNKYLFERENLYIILVRNNLEQM